MRKQFGVGYMDEIFTIIKQDLKVAEKAIVENDLNFVVIIGNRIMTNLLVADRTDFMILGWLIRDLGLDLLYIESKKEKLTGKYKAIDRAKEISGKYLIEVMEEIERESPVTRIIYDKYYILQSELRKFILSNKERIVYDERPEFTKKYAIKMVDIFYANKKIALTKNNNLIPSITGELSRIYNEYSGKDALYVYFIFKAFYDIYKYSYVEMFFNEEKDVIWDTKTKLNEYFDLIYNFKFNLINDEEDKIYNTFNEIMAKIGSDFRLYYLNYREIQINIPGEEIEASKGK